MLPPLPPTLQACLAAANAGDEEAYLACVDESTVFYGGITGLEHTGLAAIRGAFRAGQDLLRHPTFLPLRYFGDELEGALKLRYTMEGGRGASLEGIWHVRFAPSGRFQFLSLIWNPTSLLGDPPSSETLNLSPEAQAILAAYFATYNAGDDAAHIALMAPDIVYWGSGSKIVASGTLDAQSISRGARQVFRVGRLEPLAWFGKGSAVAIETRFHHAEIPGRTALAMIVIRLDDHHRIRRLNILWKPTELLSPAF